MLGHYRIESKLGEGGMGVVYKARDVHLDRLVAIKVLAREAVGNPERKRRFVLEAKAASLLNHPNIITIYDIDEADCNGDSVDFIAMEYVEGQPLSRLIQDRLLSVEEVLSYSVQIASALAVAHTAGLIHRDIKPANIMVTSSGHVKVLDFGLAKLLDRNVGNETASTVTAGVSTKIGAILGTTAYMSPEQAEGKPVDSRADIFSFGAVLYEMLAGRRPFQGGSQVSTLMAVLRDTPAPLKRLRPEVPAKLHYLVSRCLEKDAKDRYASAGELGQELTELRMGLIAPRISLRYLLRRPQFAVVALVGVLLVTAAVAWVWTRTSRERWARQVALPEISHLIERQDFYAAFRLARQVMPYLPGEPQLERLWREYALPMSIRTDPPGAEVQLSEYLAPDDKITWAFVGRTPIEKVLVPLGPARIRLSKAGFETVEAVLDSPIMERTLEPPGAAPPGMVRVKGGRYQFGSAAPVELQDYWLDKYEVTNRLYKEFMDRGGYEDRGYWKHAFYKEGRELTWRQATAEFRDATGRPGPATWELGSYPEGQADFPVSGVSWYEAAAYAEFVKKALPTIYHWYYATGALAFSEIIKLSNFGGHGPAAVRSHKGMGTFGTFDMAGNVREWCWNSSGNRRYILGGAWNEPAYSYIREYAQSPFDRSATNGFRCAKYRSPPTQALAGPVETSTRDYMREKPVGEEIFRVYRNIYSYDRTDLKATIESVDDSAQHWRKEKVTFNAAYDGERVTAYLFLPRNTVPPYQTVIYFPTVLATFARSSEGLELQFVDFLMRGGRAVLYPVYKGTYERRTDPSSGGPNLYRDQVIQRFKDLARSIDYLETRRDIDRDRLAFYGYSYGALEGVVLTALEQRLKSSVLLAGGFNFNKLPAEVDPLHFAPRIRIPVLMVNGRDDFRRPVETSQTPLFRLLGTPPQHKRHALLDGGHVPYRFQDVIREILDWLDRYLGPVKNRASAQR